ncbi:YrhB domain-containing protein [Streptomyces sp. NRRL F-5135]|uniref:YrhB domain-containing protein n=1 Tax=Streptomyces sp. NRRL F-5135 TaxID=1463858 RepID=UPI0007C48C56|nr:YrhB domain-containing protein [Streptomyces sp. NRRL F-5135]
MYDPQQQAQHWLDVTYHGLVELAAPGPVAQDAHTWLFACRTKPQPGYPRTPMLAASVAVPKNGMPPFHPAADDPWGDLNAFARAPVAREPAAQARRLNARGCVVTVSATMGGAPASPLPWSPAHEAPGWWELLLKRYFPGAEQISCASWDEVIVAAREPGPGTGGVVWVRREMAGEEVSGHLVYAHNDNGQVVFLDGMTGGLARLDVAGLRTLAFARLRPADGAPAPAPDPVRQAAGDLRTAVEKAEAWLLRTYDEPVELVEPDASDEMARGWLFACESGEYRRGGDWSRAMLDAAVVVPKDRGEPFCLPNSSPWSWLDAWNGGAEPGDGTLSLPPRPGTASWLTPTLRQLGKPVAVAEHADWDGVLAELAELPVGGRALVWVRRKDARGRESVGLLLTGFRSEAGSGLVDSSADPVMDLQSVGAAGFRFIRYR